MAEGVYLATTYRFVFDVTGPPGSGERRVATRFHVLSAGRFHRGWDLPGVPGGVPAAYDFAAAERDDPYNAGAYEVDGETIVFHPVQGDPEHAALDGDALLAEGLRFERATPGPTPA
ncbi:hypothetical protein [Microbacterium sp. HJ5]